MEHFRRLLLAGLALLCFTSLIGADPGHDGSVAKSRNAFVDFYRAIDEHRCQDASELRPGYDEEGCNQITDVISVKAQPVSVDPISVNGELVVMALEIEMTKNGMLEHWIGFATILQQAGKAIILDDSYLSHTKAGDLDGYRNSSTYQSLRRRLASQDAVAENTPGTRIVLDAIPAGSSTTLPPRRSTPIESNASASDSDPADSHSLFKADSLLHACWTPRELRAYPDERKIRTRLPVDDRPPEKVAPDVVRPDLAPEFARSIRSVKPRNGEKLVALTFDLCEKASEVTGYDGELIDTLRQQGVHATLYAGGKWMRSHPERTMQLMADPLFELGNHAWTHGNLRVLHGQEVEDQIQWTQAQYEILRAELLSRPCATALPPHQTHAVPESLATFRFPYGTCDMESLTRVARAGLYPIQWDVVTGDPAKGQTADRIVNGVLDRVRPGSIVIGHANGRGRYTAEALKTLIPALRERGYRFVTVSELLRSGEVVTAETCYEQRPGDNQRYDRRFGHGTE